MHWGVGPLERGERRNELVAGSRSLQLSRTYAYVTLSPAHHAAHHAAHHIFLTMTSRGFASTTYVLITPLLHNTSLVPPLLPRSFTR